MNSDNLSIIFLLFFQFYYLMITIFSLLYIPFYYNIYFNHGSVNVQIYTRNHFLFFSSDDLSDCKFFFNVYIKLK